MQPVSAVTSAQPAAPQRGPLLRRLWHGRSVRAQLLVVFVLIDIVALIVGGSVAVLRARTQARVETAASMGLAEALVRDAVQLAHQQISAEQLPGELAGTVAIDTSRADSGQGRLGHSHRRNIADR